jgi:predicted TIM-barrel fold metal-dependent hydrolase
MTNDETRMTNAGRPLSLPFAIRHSSFVILLALLCASAPLRETFLLQAQEPTPASSQAQPLEPAPEDPTKPAPLDGQDGRQLALDQFRPKSMLELPEHRPQRAKFPTVDVHTHMRRKLRQSPEALAEFVRLMDNQNIAVCVSLDGELGESFQEHTQFLWNDYRDRFVIFANIDWQGAGADEEPATWDCLRSDFGRRMAVALEDAKRQGASGLKIFKDLGLVYRDADGSLLKVDDPRWDPIWEACGRLGLPVLIHTADPAAFFEPVDRFNERWEELRRHPQWCCRGPEFPTQDELLAQLMRVVARHPKTTFIGAHVGNNAENLREVAQWLDTYPNFHIEIAARIAELGRQPYSARDLFMNYPDRILFGTDGPREIGRLIPHWRMLETADEYFPYAEDQYPPQGLWNIYGLHLPDEVLRKVYYENACRLIPGVRERLERLQVAHK